ncbi:structural maintenance of chromosomes protein 6 [Marchantia polymorpha subsp. ruderalis]|uniref:RecF/RecN/SMC N-terminal domain-containing protein n=2 Tax=Marchantia polymorpha TaxID=3197 RepID=A0AAF6BY30_MARPO|nr:hypothetical protein MARPO_0003s0057 [Marchantia polymorpha]PTQ49155.1 hypothetical protein MARPO_0003s0057 [Marchantia polymorpha]BBN16913.1 hypothetical protein Mp_7g10380 [Marchantia polymorpha subsp. ruderalis]BBN16914.1 hypothetical protein Mp_7g10380 [Marchantia polymorpha subsp. ruderalis]|eukprot:PTQ49154.1 hypothetical protein MARPO_0003s0057 [Marchantia polymorpha]
MDGAEEEELYMEHADGGEDDTGYADFDSCSAQYIRAGTIRRIRVENFMCHSNLSIDFIDRVNFITGQNGSGKSAILTAILVAFGIKAKGTQRANSIKDFVKNGCRTASVVVELNNEGLDAYKPDVYGDTIMIERRITENGSHFQVSGAQGKKVGSKKSDVLDIVEHFNIDVENPCILMTQDKSREFLHAGSEKDKFMFFFKATLQQTVSEKLVQAEEAQNVLGGIIEESLQALQPLQNQLKQVEEQIKYKQQVEQLHEQIEELERKLAWSWVYEVEREMTTKQEELEKIKKRIPQCQKKIDEAKAKVSTIGDLYSAKRSEIDRMMTESQQLKHTQESLKRDLHSVTKQRVEAEENVNRCRRSIEQLGKQLHTLQLNVQEMQLRALEDTQAEEDVRLQEIRQVENAIATATAEVQRFGEEESRLTVEAEKLRAMILACDVECREKVLQIRDVEKYIRELSSRQGNQMTAFGGNNILNLMRRIEENNRRFTCPPLGPIGAHVTLIDERWSLAVEVATRNLLDSFIVTNQKDMLLLRRLANQANCRNLNICIYDFDRHLLKPTDEQLPDPNLATVMTTLQTENPTIMNVFIDQGSVERLVLAEDYESAKSVAFGGGSKNVKEVITIDGTRLYSRAGGETTLPKERWIRGGRLGVRVSDQIQEAHEQEKELRSSLEHVETRKRRLEGEYSRLARESGEYKRRRIGTERKVKTLELTLQEMKQREALEKNVDANVDELEQEMNKIREEIERKQDIFSTLNVKWDEAKQSCQDAKEKLEALLDSARGEFEALGTAEQDLLSLQEDMSEAASEVRHYQELMDRRVLAVIASQEMEIAHMQKQVEVNAAKASQICARDEVPFPGVDNLKPDQLSMKLNRLRERVRKEEDDSDTLEQLKKKGSKIKRRLQSKEDMFLNLKRKLETLVEGLGRRKKKFDRNAQMQKRELTWKFNEHLRKKGFSGKVNVDYQKRSLTLHVTMPHDESHTSVQDTRALSGGERSYSTLAFALAVHQMTEAPFRAMDEFDIFMDPVSRKISLDSVVQFATSEGSQWILITPHDISMVAASPLLKKQMMPAPRP